MSSLLQQTFKGDLKVIVHTLSGIEDHENLGTLPGKEDTLFGYVGRACANLFTNFTTQLVIETCMADWEVVRFSPEERVLEVKQIGGEPLDFEEESGEEDVNEYPANYGYFD